MTQSGAPPEAGATTRGITIPAELEQFLGRLGINEETLENLKSALQNVDVEEHLNTAREYLRNTSEKAKVYTKENPAKVAAGVAVLAIGAGLLISALKRDDK
jgi:hypothetical protein